MAGIACPHCQKVVPDAIPKIRLDQESEKRQTAEKERDVAKTSLVEAETNAKLGETAVTERDAAKAELALVQEDHSIDKALSPYIADSDVRSGFAQSWRKLEAEGRPAFGEWFAAQAKEPDKVNGLLRSHLPTMGEDGKLVPLSQGAGNTEGAPDLGLGPLIGEGGAPNVGGSAPRTGSPGAPSQFTAEQIRTLRSTPAGLQKLARMRTAIGNQLGIDMPELADSNPLKPKGADS